MGVGDCGQLEIFIVKEASVFLESCDVIFSILSLVSDGQWWQWCKWPFPWMCPYLASSTPIPVLWPFRSFCKLHAIIPTWSHPFASIHKLSLTKQQASRGWGMCFITLKGTVFTYIASPQILVNCTWCEAKFNGARTSASSICEMTNSV